MDSYIVLSASLQRHSIALYLNYMLLLFELAVTRTVLIYCIECNATVFLHEKKMEQPLSSAAYL